MKPQDVSTIARSAIDMVREMPGDILQALKDGSPEADWSDIARALRYAVVISNDQQDFDTASRLAPIVEEARRREVEMLESAADAARLGSDA